MIDVANFNSSSKNSVSTVTLPLRTLAGIICDSGAASMVEIHEFVVHGFTGPIVNAHCSRSFPLNLANWTILKFFSSSTVLKFISRSIALTSRMPTGTRTSCISLESEKSFASWKIVFPSSEFVSLIQFLKIMKFLGH